ncbi:hypothetical protein BC833DRAFT_636942 [Globomyces pollinis-pini]|nr:hypothetical protein BC833DRAFT_636942 [Globomyces pollinis-pini]
MKTFAIATLAASVLADAPSKVTITDITYGGSGCPAGSLSGWVSDDNTKLTLDFDQFVARSGTGVISDTRKNCQVSVLLNYPQGFSYSIAKIDYYGHVKLPQGLKATQKSTYYFSGESNQVSFESTFDGPVDRPYAATDFFQQAVWSPCGISTRGNVNAQVRISGSPADVNSKAGEISVDQATGKVRRVFALNWKQYYPLVPNGVTIENKYVNRNQSSIIDINQ